MTESLEGKIIEDIINYAKSIRDKVKDKEGALKSAEQTNDEEKIVVSKKELDNAKLQQSNFIFHMLIPLLFSPQENKTPGSILTGLEDVFVNETK